MGGLSQNRETTGRDETRVTSNFGGTSRDSAAVGQPDCGDFGGTAETLRTTEIAENCRKRLGVVNRDSVGHPSLHPFVRGSPVVPRFNPNQGKLRLPRDARGKGSCVLFSATSAVLSVSAVPPKYRCSSGVEKLRRPRRRVHCFTRNPDSACSAGRLGMGGLS